MFKLIIGIGLVAIGIFSPTHGNDIYLLGNFISFCCGSCLIAFGIDDLKGN